MAKSAWKRKAKRIAAFVLALGCVAVSFGASAYGACELRDSARQRAADAAEEARDPYSLGFAVEDSGEPLEVDTYDKGDFLHFLYVYGSDYYDLCFDGAVDEVSADGLKDLVRANDGIPDRFKGEVCDFVDAVVERYPEIDLRVLRHNLKTIEIEDRSAEEVQAECSEFTAGYYNERDNRICISSENGYAKYTWDCQLLTHELCHAMRRSRFERAGVDVHVHPAASGASVVDEAFTSIFAGELLDCELDELAYQPEVNEVLVMLECVDGYEPCDFFSKSVSHFASRLDATCGDNNYAMKVFKLMQVQHDDYQDDSVCRDRAAYHPVYDYLVRLYLDKHASPGMSPGAVDRLLTDLVDKVGYGVPDDYGLDVGEFYRYGQEYYAQKFGA